MQPPPGVFKRLPGSRASLQACTPPVICVRGRLGTGEFRAERPAGELDGRTDAGLAAPGTPGPASAPAALA